MLSISRAKASFVVFACATALASLTPLLGSCSDGTASSSSDAKPVLADVTGSVILPAYRLADAAAGELVAKTNAFAATPSAQTLLGAQNAWRSSRKAWHATEAFRFGPVKTKNITSAIDFWPARLEGIEAFVGGVETIDASTVDALGANAKGFMALEALFFDSAAGDAAVLTRFVSAPHADRRRRYAGIVAALVQAKTSELATAWEPTGGNFARELTEAGSGSALFPSGKSAIDQLVNSVIFATDLVTGTKLGKPYGTKSGGEPRPADEESARSDNSLVDMVSTLDGVRVMYAGAGGKGLSDLVRAKNPSLDARVLAAMEDVLRKVAAIPPPFRTAITSQRPAVENAYQAARTLKNLLSTEVATALATTLAFNDSDGD